MSFLHVPPPAVIAITGSGGKTTVMHQLADQWAAAGHRVIVTTTTHIRQPPYALVSNDPIAPGSVRAALGPAVEADKFAGPGRDELRSLQSRCDYLLVEADGSRGFPLKAYRETEPVLPFDTDAVLTVVGYNAIGTRHVHRPELLADRIEWDVDQLIDIGSFVAAITHPQQYFRHGFVPVSLLLNQAPSLAQAEAVVERLAFEAGVRRVLLRPRDGEPFDTDMPAARPVGVTILAGGSASRMGRPKQLEEWQGKPLLRHVVDAWRATTARPIVVVVGAAAERIASVLPADVEVVNNPEFEEGLASSLRCGVQAMPPGVAVAVALADMPAIRPATLQRLVDTAAVAPDPFIVAPLQDGVRGHPVIFSAGLRRELDALQGDRGAAAVVQKHMRRVMLVPTEDRGVRLDIDHPDDLVRLQQT